MRVPTADFVPPDDEFWLTLAPTNRLVTARNRQHLERLPGDELVHHARGVRAISACSIRRSRRRCGSRSARR